MDIVASDPWQHILSVIVILLGLLVFWHGLLGQHGLFRPGIGTLQRIEGWRLILVGLTVVGLGLAWFLDVGWLVVLSLAIGFVEIQESTHVIQAWRLGDTRKKAADHPHPVQRSP